MKANMDVLETIYTRASIRKYTEEPLSEEEEKILLKAGFCAPTTANRRPWQFLVIREKQALQDIADHGTYTKMMANAAACIVVCGNEKRLPIMSYLIDDCAAAIENILLAAHGIGLGAVWCGLAKGDEFYDYIKARFQIPDHMMPAGLIAVGHPAETRERPERYEEKKVHHEVW